MARFYAFYTNIDARFNNRQSVQILGHRTNEGGFATEAIARKKGQIDADRVNTTSKFCKAGPVSVIEFESREEAYKYLTEVNYLIKGD